MDFYGNLNKGIENIIPLAMQKFKIDQDEARWQTENKMKQDLFDMQKQDFIEKLKQKSLETEMREGLMADVDKLEGLKGKLPALQKEMQIAGGGDVDVGADPERYGLAKRQITELAPQLKAAEESLAPMNLIRRMLPVDTKSALSSMVSMLNQESKLANALELMGIRSTMSDKVNDARFQMLLANIAGKRNDKYEMTPKEAIGKQAQIASALSRLGKGSSIDALVATLAPELSGQIGSNDPEALELAKTALRNQLEYVQKYVPEKMRVGIPTTTVRGVEFKSADEVKTAYQSGKITRDNAKSILQKNFGYQ